MMADVVAPAAVTAWRSPNVTAIAASGWAMLIVDAALAGAYGLLAVPPHVRARVWCACPTGSTRTSPGTT